MILIIKINVAIKCRIQRKTKQLRKIIKIRITKIIITKITKIIEAIKITEIMKIKNQMKSYLQQKQT